LATAAGVLTSTTTWSMELLSLVSAEAAEVCE